MALQKFFNLPEDKIVPVFGMVARLCQQKGVDLVVQAMDELVALGGQAIITGVGERKYHRMLEECANRYPNNVGLYLKFEEPIAHRVYAGSDFFLMPSSFEPCGSASRARYRLLETHTL